MGLSNSTWKLPKLAFLKGRVYLGRVLPIFLVFTLIFAFLPFFNQASGQTPQTKITVINKAYPTKGLPYIGYPNGPDVILQIKVNDVTDPDGLAGFSIKLRYDKTIVSVADTNNDNIADQDAVQPDSFLTSSGKQSACSDAFLDPDQTNPNKMWLTYSCVTLGLTPSAALGTGALATIKFKPKAILGSTSFGSLETELVDNTQSANLIPHTPGGASILITKCANFNGADDNIDVPNDILPLILRYNWNTSNPNWDPKYDLNNDGRIDVPNDILVAIFQYGMHCTR